MSRFEKVNGDFWNDLLGLISQGYPYILGEKNFSIINCHFQSNMWYKICFIFSNINFLFQLKIVIFQSKMWYKKCLPPLGETHQNVTPRVSMLPSATRRGNTASLGVTFWCVSPKVGKHFYNSPYYNRLLII